MDVQECLSACRYHYLIPLGLRLSMVTFNLAESLFQLTRRRMHSLESLRAEWDARPRDMVTLHTFLRARNGISMSPFGIKLETYLRAAGVK